MSKMANTLSPELNQILIMLSADDVVLSDTAIGIQQQMDGYC